MKKCFQFLLFLLSIICLQNCKFPKSDLDDLNINIDGNLVNSIVSVNLYTDDSLPVEKLAFFVSGKNAADIYDQEGKYNFNAEGGHLNLILSPNAKPTPNNPWVFIIEAQKEGYLPIKEEVFIFDTKTRIKLKYTFKRPVNLTPGVDYTALSLKFLGKSRPDTLSFNFKRSDGIEFTFKYPSKGLSFIRKSSLKYTNEDAKISLVNLLENPAIFQFDSLSTAIPQINNFLQKFNKLPINGKVSCIPLSIFSKTHSELTRIGYNKQTQLTEYKNKLCPDTVVLTNVMSNIVSYSNFFEFGYFDENGNEINSLSNFENAIGFPQVYFYEANTGYPIVPYYSNGGGGVSIEVALPNNSYKLFANGIEYSTSTNQYYQVNRAIDLSSDAFSINDLGKFVLKFSDNMLMGRFFLYSSSTQSCGYSNISISYPKIPLNIGFLGEIEISNSKNNSTYPIDFNNAINTYRVAAFPNEITSIKMLLDHPLNKCNKGPVLFSGEIGSASMCNYTTSDLNLVASYDPSVFASGLINLAPLTAEARINCPSGNYVVPPTTNLAIYNLGCSAENLIVFENGKFFSPNLIKSNQTYVVRYDKPNTVGKPTLIYDTLTFDTSIPEIKIADEKTGYWTGLLTYDIVNGFNLNIFFDNKKMKLKIPNCN